MPTIEEVAVEFGGCSFMFVPTADGGHWAMRLVCTLTANVPRWVR